jgi:hypothetical protein
MKLLNQLLYYCAILLVALCFMTYLKIHRGSGDQYGPNAFVISGKLANGDTISGTVRITTHYGSFYGGPVFISGPQSFILDEVLAGYQLNAQTYVGEATVTQPECPMLFYAVQASRIQSYTGGAIEPNSGLKLCDGSYIPLVSGVLVAK